ncbi:glycosyltransferase [Stutzerimonas zhaodongensis]|uniref:glycosyltransferase n=1 Tax=Stutzerimonas TaxID=2901164 RepID=UPI0038907205
MRNHRSISVIIPCWRDERALARLLDRLVCVFITAAVPGEIIVVDGANSETCKQLCERFAAHWLPSEPCRGKQLRLGASHARYPLLWFLHADAELAGEPLGAMLAATGNGAVGGYFRFRFAGAPSWQGSVLERLINWRCRLGVPYGDQGLFVDAAQYQICGQHSPWQLFEEVELVKKLRRQGRFVRLDDGVRVDPRRWQRDGWWQRSLRNRILALKFACGVPADRLARQYNARKHG